MEERKEIIAEQAGADVSFKILHPGIEMAAFSIEKVLEMRPFQEKLALIHFKTHLQRAVMYANAVGSNHNAKFMIFNAEFMIFNAKFKDTSNIKTTVSAAGMLLLLIAACAGPATMDQSISAYYTAVYAPTESGSFFGQKENQPRNPAPQRRTDGKHQR